MKLLPDMTTYHPVTKAIQIFFAELDATQYRTGAYLLPRPGQYCKIILSDMEIKRPDGSRKSTKPREEAIKDSIKDIFEEATSERRKAEDVDKDQVFNDYLHENLNNLHSEEEGFTSINKSIPELIEVIFSQQSDLLLPPFINAHPWIKPRPDELGDIDPLTNPLEDKAVRVPFHRPFQNTCPHLYMLTVLVDLKDAAEVTYVLDTYNPFLDDKNQPVFDFRTIMQNMGKPALMHKVSFVKEYSDVTYRAEMNALRASTFPELDPPELRVSRASFDRVKDLATMTPRKYRSGAETIPIWDQIACGTAGEH